VLKLTDLAAKLAEWGLGVPTSYDVQPETPHNHVTLIATGGLGTTVERAFDRPTFQALTRGATGRDASETAHRLDRLILDAETPFDLGDYRVIDAGRVGGGPGFLGTDDRRRTEYSASYWLEIER
jgi:hypothetical protein